MSQGPFIYAFKTVKGKNKSFACINFSYYYLLFYMLQQKIAVRVMMSLNAIKHLKTPEYSWERKIKKKMMYGVIIIIIV